MRARNRSLRRRRGPGRRAASGPSRLPNGIRLRRARSQDSAGILRIYNEAVATTSATFDTEPRTAAAHRRWMFEHRLPYLVMVAVRSKEVVAWSSLGSWSPRPAYAGTAEVSEYVAPPWRGRGIGSALLARLVREADRRGFHTLLARVADGNAASLRLHAAHGFRPVGVMREVGLKFGRRIDVHLLQRLDPGGADRRPPRSPRGNRFL